MLTTFAIYYVNVTTYHLSIFHLRKHMYLVKINMLERDICIIMSIDSAVLNFKVKVYDYYVITGHNINDKYDHTKRIHVFVNLLGKYI